jgi:hypothetical protein
MARHHRHIGRAFMTKSSRLDFVKSSSNGHMAVRINGHPSRLDFVKSSSNGHMAVRINGRLDLAGLI